jgi:hypothetical protein
MEIYKDIKGYEGLYQVSNYGFVKSLNRVIVRSDGRKRTIKERIKEGTHNKGYKRISLCDNNGNSKSLYVHRLVAEAFIGVSNLVVDHIDGNKANNHIDNLRYVTNQQNLIFRNTETKYKSRHPYIYYDNKRNQYRVYKVGKRFNTYEEALIQAKCLLGQLQ